MAVQYTATVKTVVPQLVHCVHCDCHFVYEMTVTGYETVESGLTYSDSGAKEAAEQGARNHLNSQLNDPELCHSIPCRECFRYQPYMAKRVSRSKYTEVGCYGYLVGGFGGLAVLGALGAWYFLPAQRPLPLWVGLGGLVAWLAGYGLLRWERRLIEGHDPNAERQAERVATARERTMTLDQFEDLQGIRARHAYSERPASVPKHKPPWAGSASAKGLPGGSSLVDWWVLPTVFLNGGTVSFRVTDEDYVTVIVPEDTQPGTVFDIQPPPQGVVPFRVRVLAIRVHPDEYRLE